MAGIAASELFELDDLVIGLLDKFLYGEFELKEKDGIPFLGNAMSLLLHKLDDTRFSSVKELKSSLNCAGASRAILLVGTSGCGKTRTLYTYLSQTFGLYLVANARGNGGSDDVKFIADILGCRLQDGNHAQNTEMVNFAVRLLLVARLKIFKHCRARGINPNDWLLLQAAWKGYVNKHGEMLQDVFHIQQVEVYKRVDWGRWTDLSTGALNYLNELCEELGGMPDILLDEAQELLQRYWKRDFFVSSSPSREWRSLARDFLGALVAPSPKQTAHRLVAAGVALPLVRAMVEISSGMLKVLGDPPKAISPFGVWDLNSMLEFIKLSLGSHDPADLQLVEKYVFPVFRGRYRFLVTALEIKLMSGRSLREAADLLRDVLGLPVEEATERAGFSFAKTMHDSIEQLRQYPDVEEKCGTDCDKCEGGKCKYRVKLISYLERATIRYFLQHESYPITEADAVNKLIEAGVARTRPEGGGAVIDEFLVLQAYLTYNGGLRWLRQVAMDQIVQTTTKTGKGDMYQQLVGLCFLQMWKRRRGKLSVIFNEVMEDSACPGWLRNELANGQVTLLEGICPLQTSKSFSAATKEFLEASVEFPNESSLLVRDKENGQDIVGRGMHTDGRFVEFHIQTKLLEDEMGHSARKEALDSFTPRTWNTETTISIGFLVLCPRQRGNPKFVCGQKNGDPRSFELIVTVGEENADLLFSSHEMQQLIHQKPHRQKRKRTASF